MGRAFRAEEEPRSKRKKRNDFEQFQHDRRRVNHQAKRERQRTDSVARNTHRDRVDINEPSESLFYCTGCRRNMPGVMIYAVPRTNLAKIYGVEFGFKLNVGFCPRCYDANLKEGIRMDLVGEPSVVGVTSLNPTTPGFGGALPSGVVKIEKVF